MREPNGRRREGLLATLAVIGALYGGAVFAEIREVQAVGRAVVDAGTTLSEAKHAALSEARALAVEQAAGVSVMSTALLQDSLIVGELVKTFAHGLLVAEKEVVWTGSWSKAAATDLGFPLVEVKLTARVDVRPKTFFRNDVIAVSLDKHTYRDGELAKLTITAAHDLYFLVANYTSKSKIMPIFPHHPRQRNLLVAGETVELPEQDGGGWDILMRNYAGHATDTEAMIVLAFPSDEALRGIVWTDLFGDAQEVEYAEFFDRVLSLPLAWLGQQTLVYTIVRR